MRWAAMLIGVDSSDTAVEAAGQLLIESGCAGVSYAVGAHDELTAVTGYLPVDDRLSGARRSLEAALQLLPSIGISGVASELIVTMVEEEDWANAWKRYFKPIRIGRHLIVTPPWETPDMQDGDKVIEIDPGMAFGTGTHPTTQLCLTALEDYVRPDREFRVADIGTGSGILAIAAKKLGAAYVFATDTDPLALSIAQKNASINEVAIDNGVEPSSTGEYDVLVANILADSLMGLAEQFSAMLKPSGIYIGSGIIEGREDDVRLYTEAEGFSSLETRRQGEWVALVFRKAAL